eukprot:296936_1
MGQACGCSDGPQQEERIKELQALLSSEQDDYKKLKHNYEKLTNETGQLIHNSKKSSSKLKSQIKALQSEKQHAFKEMMKEKKKITKLEETKSEMERTKRKMERQIQQYKHDIAKYDQESSHSKGDDDYDAMDAKSVRSNVSVTPQPQSHADVDASIDEIQQWLDTVTGDKRQDHKIFNKRMTELLTKLTKAHQLRIVEVWEQQHRNTIFEAIEKKLGGKTRGAPYRVLSGLLQSEAEVDKVYIQECIYHDMQIDKVADVIVTRTVDELRELQVFWKKQYETSLFSMLEKLAKHYNKNTMLHLFQNLCNTDQRERNKHFQSKAKVNTIEIAKHIEWMMLTNKWKHQEKEKLCKLFTLNSDAYVQILCKQYKSKSKNEHISHYIDTKFGAKSMFGRHIKDHIAFVEDPNLYFAKRLLVLADSKQNFKENNLQILNIFLSQFQSNLNQIRITFNQMHDETLRHYIKNMGANHNSVYFLMKLLDNSKRFDR